MLGRRRSPREVNKNAKMACKNGETGQGEKAQDERIG